MTRRRRDTGSTRARRRQAERAHAGRVTLATTIPLPPADGEPWHYWWNTRDARWYRHRPEVIAFIADLARGPDHIHPDRLAHIQALTGLAPAEDTDTDPT